MAKKWIIIGGLALATGVAVRAAEPTPIPHYEFHSIDDLWTEVQSDPYSTLPQTPVTVTRFFSGFKDLLLERSRATLVDQNDLIPRFEKLVHPNGLCLKGSWNITEDSPYTGAFRKGTAAPFIGRASTALTNTKAGENRAFGFAGKIFGDASTANFFTIEDLGGTRRDHFLDAELTNDIIQISPTFTVFLKGLVGATVFKDFPQAEGSNLQTALIRELYPISELDLKDGEAPVTPIWLKIKASPDMPRINEADFRDELKTQFYPAGLRFDIIVASEGSRFGDKAWQRIGFIQLDESVASDTCDHRLHFSHPKARKIY